MDSQHRDFLLPADNADKSCSYHPKIMFGSNQRNGRAIRKGGNDLRKEEEGEVKAK